LVSSNLIEAVNNFKKKNHTGAAQFVRKKKRDWEEHQFVKLGGKVQRLSKKVRLTLSQPAKQQKILYTHKMGIDKRKKELEQKKIEVVSTVGCLLVVSGY